MPLDKFGRRDYRPTQTLVNETTAVVSLSQMNDTFLRRDGTNTAVGTINMTGNTFTNVSSPVDDHDAANKAYVDNAGISKTGGEMLGHLDMNNFRLTGLPPGVPEVGSDAVGWSQAVQLVKDSEINCVKKTGDIINGNLVLSADGNEDRILGCINLDPERSFTIPIGTTTNKLYYVFRREPVVLYTDNGFLVKARNQDICQLGTVDDPSEIIFHKDVRMNSNRITNLPVPTLPHEAVNKLYVDGTPRKILHGYVPNLRSSSANAPNDKFGFIVTASSNHSTHFLPINAFNGLYKDRTGAGGEWITRNETRDFWIQIQCPDLVRLWRIALRGRNINTDRIYRWRLEASTDGQTFTTLFDAPNPTYIGDEVRYFPIETSDRYNIFRLFCLEAEPTNPGLSFVQLYVYSE